MPILETIALMALLFGAVACLSWDDLKNWISSNSPTSAADLVKTALDNGNVQIVAIGLDSAGRTAATKSWKAKSLDAELSGRFGSANRVRVNV